MQRYKRCCFRPATLRPYTENTKLGLEALRPDLLSGFPFSDGLLVYQISYRMMENELEDFFDLFDVYF